MSLIRSKYPDVRVPENISWPDFIFQHFHTYGEDVAVLDSTTDRHCTFSNLRELTTRTASGLAKRGFQKGDVLGMYSPNSPEYVLMLFAALRLGGIVTPVNPTYTGYEAAVQLKMAGATWLMTTSGLGHRAKEASRHAGIKCDHIITDVYVLEDYLLLSSLAEDDGSCFPDVNINPRQDVALLPYSTENVGGPKLAMLTHSNLVANCCLLRSRGFFTFNKGSVVLASLPFSHVYSLVALLAVALQCGCRVVTAPRFKQDSFLPILERHKVTHLTISAQIAQFLASHPSVDRYDLTALTEVASGSASLGREISEAITRRLPFIGRIRHGYGIPELGAVSHMTPADGSSPDGPILLPNLECKIVDVDANKTVEEGRTGEIFVRGPIVMEGYHNDPEATQKMIDIDGWLRTGDTGYYKDKQLHIVGKGRDVIKYKSYRVLPAELEALLLSHSSIVDATVIGVPHPTNGEVPKAFVVIKSNTNLKESDVAEFVAENVATYKKLRGGIEIVDEIPRSDKGRVMCETLLSNPNKTDSSKLVPVKKRRNSIKHGYLYAKNIHNNVVHPISDVTSKACVIL